MTSSQLFRKAMGQLKGSQDRVFATSDLRCLLPDRTDAAFKPLLTRMVQREELIRLCRGVYMLPDCNLRGSALLGHVAALLRADGFNYISLETALSDAGIISQIPMSRLTLMSSGRRYELSCGLYGTVEFVHTNKTPKDLEGKLTYDSKCGLWRANIRQALRDMKDTQRDTGLVNWEMAHELI